MHGYSERESQRLADQANTLAELLHYDTAYPAGSMVLEAGCGVGAQTVILAKNSPGARLTSVDISRASLAQADDLIRRAKITNVAFLEADIFNLPFAEESFDHVFVCFVLEHLEKPVAALAALRRVLKTGGTITVIEGDHGSCYFHPETDEALQAWRCLIKVQAHLKGNSLVGRQVYPLLKQASFREISVSPRMVYCDASRPELTDGFVKKTIIPMVEGVKKQALALGLIDKSVWEKGIRDLHRTGTPPEGTFCYTFFKGVAYK